MANIIFCVFVAGFIAGVFFWHFLRPKPDAVYVLTLPKLPRDVLDSRASSVRSQLGDRGVVCLQSDEKLCRI